MYLLKIILTNFENATLKLCTLMFILKQNEFYLYYNFNHGCGSVGMMRTAICMGCLTDMMAAGQLTLLRRECLLSCCSDSCQEKHQMKTSKIYWTRLKNTICIITLLKLNITFPYQIFTIWQHLFKTLWLIQFGIPPVVTYLSWRHLLMKCIKVAHHIWIKFLKSRRNSLMMKNEVTYDRYGYTKSKWKITFW